MCGGTCRLFRVSRGPADLAATQLLTVQEALGPDDVDMAQGLGTLRSGARGGYRGQCEARGGLSEPGVD